VKNVPRDRTHSTANASESSVNNAMQDTALQARHSECQRNALRKREENRSTTMLGTCPAYQGAR